MTYNEACVFGACVIVASGIALLTPDPLGICLTWAAGFIAGGIGIPYLRSK